MRLRLRHQPTCPQMANALDPLPLVVPTIGVHGSHFCQVCRVHRLFLVDRNCSLSQVGDGVQVLKSHFFDEVKKIFFGDGGWMGVKYRSSRPRRCGPRGGCGQIARLAAVTCPQVFVHSYPQIPVNNSIHKHNVSINLWITTSRLYIMVVVGSTVSLRYA
jgi:hypothetical protein